MKNYLIQRIIKKTEDSSVDWRRTSGNRSVRIQQVDYDVYGKSALLDEAEELAAAGLVQIDWQERGNDIKRICYRLKDLPEFYRMLGVVPKQKVISDYEAVLNAQLSKIHKEWIRKYYEYLLSRLAEGKIPGDLEKGELLYACMRGLDALEEPTFVRVFRRQYLHGSKVFEKQMQSHVLSVATRYCEEITEDMDDSTKLSQIYLEEYSQEMAVKGPLKLSVRRESAESAEETKKMDLADFPYGTILNSQTLKYARISEPAPELKYVLTIENKANFVSVPYREDTLYIFSHGYFSPKEREFLVRMREAFANRGIQYFHSGDLDYGGIRIYKYNKQRIFPELRPYQMDVKTYEQYRAYAEPIEKQTLEKLEKMEKPEVPDLQELVEKLLETGRGIEQESFLIRGESTLEHR